MFIQLLNVSCKDVIRLLTCQHRWLRLSQLWLLRLMIRSLWCELWPHVREQLLQLRLLLTCRI